MSDLASLVSEALFEPDPRRGIERTKDIVSSCLRRAQPGVKVYRTEYFDHSYAPDLVIRHGRRGNDDERWVYLRTSNDPDHLAEDLEVTPSTGSMVISLARFAARDPASLPRLNVASSARSTLVVDTPALDEVTSHTERTDTRTVMAKALLVGGRGALDETTTEDVLETFESGVRGAIAGEAEPTRSAARQVHDRLASVQAGRITSFLGALWEASGNSPGNFPGGVNVSALDGPGLGLLLDGPEIDNKDLWRRLAAQISLETLTSATSGAPANLQRLLRAGVDTIKAHICVVLDEPPIRIDEVAEWSWAVRERRLCLVGPTFAAYLAQKRDDLPSTEQERDPIDLDELRRRARDFDIALGELRLETARRLVGYDSTGGEDVVNDPELDQIGAALQGATVARVEAHEGDETRLACDFHNGIARMVGSRTRAPIGHLAGTAIRLLEVLDDTDAQRLDELLTPLPPTRPRGSGWEQLGLDEQ